MFKNLPCNAADVGSTPGWGTKIPHATRHLIPCVATSETTHWNKDTEQPKYRLKKIFLNKVSTIKNLKKYLCHKTYQSTTPPSSEVKGTTQEMSLRKGAEKAEWGHRGDSWQVGCCGEGAEEGEKRGTSTLAGSGGPMGLEEPGQSKRKPGQAAGWVGWHCHSFRF